MSKDEKATKSYKKWRKRQKALTQNEYDGLRARLWDVLEAKERGLEQLAEGAKATLALREFEDARYELYAHVAKLCADRAKVSRKKPPKQESPLEAFDRLLEALKPHAREEGNGSERSARE